MCKILDIYQLVDSRLTYPMRLTYQQKPVLGYFSCRDSAIQAARDMEVDTFTINPLTGIDTGEAVFILSSIVPVELTDNQKEVPVE